MALYSNQCDSVTELGGSSFDASGLQVAVTMYAVGVGNQSPMSAHAPASSILRLGAVPLLERSIVVRSARNPGGGITCQRLFQDCRNAGNQ
jgi:hypothetical protein